MSDPFSRKTLLQVLPPSGGGGPEARFSAGHRLRAAQLQGFVGALHAAAETALGALPPPEVVVLSASDWRALLSHPYGWPATRRTPEGVSVVVSADYPNKLLRRWDEVLLRAAKAGAPAPGGVRAFMDALVGLEWAHAALYSAALRSRAPWLNELLAGALLRLTLAAAGDGGRVRYLEAWAAAQRAGAIPKRAKLTAFAYPRGKAPFSDLVWGQGSLMQVAGAFSKHGWDGLRALQGELGGTARAAAARVTALEPELPAWLSAADGPIPDDMTEPAPGEGLLERGGGAT